MLMESTRVGKSRLKTELMNLLTPSKSESTTKRTALIMPPGGMRSLTSTTSTESTDCSMGETGGLVSILFQVIESIVKSINWGKLRFWNSLMPEDCSISSRAITTVTVSSTAVKSSAEGAATDIFTGSGFSAEAGRSTNK